MYTLKLNRFRMVETRVVFTVDDVMIIMKSRSLGDKCSAYLI